MTDEIRQELVGIVKRHAGLAWCDERAAQTLAEQIEEAAAFLSLYDPTVDFLKDHWARGLLIAYVRYIRAGASDDFRTNYRADILALSDRGRVNAQKQAAD